jgi:hypothetical protein
VLAVGVAAATVGLFLGSASGTVGRRPRAAVTAPAAASAVTRYSLVDGCYTVGSVAPALGPFRMQAAALGVYLLYTPGGEYLTDVGGGALKAVSTPSPAAEWQVDGDGTQGFTITNAGTATKLPATFTAANGCATYPEAEVDATGTPAGGPSPEADVVGTVEGHAHITAFDFLGGDWHCGAPWSPYGAPYALPASCASEEAGTNGIFESFVDFGGLTRPAMHGWPTFRGWPSPTALAEEGDYYTGIERAWKAGLRILVTNLVDNEALCSLMTVRRNPCNDMDAVRIQSHDLYALQDYIDAQSGGPGKGWFRIVTDPFQARQVISEGKLAVVEGIEVSRLFGCGEKFGVPQCDEAQIDAGLNEIHALGVRTFFPVHEFNNAFGGTKMIGGDLGAIVNAGNFDETGSFWNLQPCPSRMQDAEQFTVGGTSAIANLLNGPLASILHGAALPLYGSGPQCNTQGLTSLGAYLINQMIKQHFIIQLDHMDSKTADAALSIVSAAHYSGVVSAHCCSSPQLFQRIYATGGFITEPTSPPAGWVATERQDKAESDSKYLFGFGWGSDMNGLAAQPGPASGPTVTYPFTSYDGRVTFTREQWGQRTFDINKDGLANYGMYADWLRQVQLEGGPQVMADMFGGAEAYLEMWERADGVPAESCIPPRERFGAAGLGSSIRLGDTAQDALFRAGQPLSRPGRSYRYCSGVSSVFNSAGAVSLIASTARGDRAGGIRPGASARQVRARAHRVMRGVWLGRRLASGARYVYGVRGRRVWFVGVVARRDGHSARALRSDLAAAGV